MKSMLYAVLAMLAFISISMLNMERAKPMKGEKKSDELNGFVIKPLHPLLDSRQYMPNYDDVLRQLFSTTLFSITRTLQEGFVITGWMFEAVGVPAAALYYLGVLLLKLIIVVKKKILAKRAAVLLKSGELAELDLVEQFDPVKTAMYFKRQLEKSKERERALTRERDEATEKEQATQRQLTELKSSIIERSLALSDNVGFVHNQVGVERRIPSRMLQHQYAVVQEEPQRRIVENVDLRNRSLAPTRRVYDVTHRDSMDSQDQSFQLINLIKSNEGRGQQPKYLISRKGTYHQLTPTEVVPLRTVSPQVIPPGYVRQSQMFHSNQPAPKQMLIYNLQNNQSNEDSLD